VTGTSADPGNPQVVIIGDVTVDRIRTADGSLTPAAGGDGLYAAYAAATRVPVGLVGTRAGHPIARDHTFPTGIDTTALTTAGNPADDAATRFDRMPAHYLDARAYHVCGAAPVLTHLALTAALYGDTRTAKATVSIIAPTTSDTGTDARRGIDALRAAADIFVCTAAQAVHLATTTTVIGARHAIATRHASGRHRTLATYIVHPDHSCDIITALDWHHIASPATTTLDPTGAVAAFAGAVIAAHADGDTWTDAGRYAVATAAATAAGPGPAALRATTTAELRRRAACLTAEPTDGR
jgi:sugar/nucleoside kinase (ribokinase family)